MLFRLILKAHERLEYMLYAQRVLSNYSDTQRSPSLKWTSRASSKPEIFMPTRALDITLVHFVSIVHRCLNNLYFSFCWWLVCVCSGEKLLNGCFRKLSRLRRVTVAHREDGARGDLRVPALLLPLSWCQLQVAGIAGAGDVAPDAGPQVDHDAAGRRHRLPRHRHQPPRCRRLGHDAELLRPPLHVSWSQVFLLVWTRKEC